MRALAFFMVPIALVVGALHCTSDDSTGPTDAGLDGGVDICDIDAYTGVGKPCPQVSGRLCFKYCDAGGVKCVQGASGPVWKNFDDFSCIPESGPLDDTGAGDAAPPDDAGSDAPDDATTDATGD